MAGTGSYKYRDVYPDIPELTGMRYYTVSTHTLDPRLSASQIYLADDNHAQTVLSGRSPGLRMQLVMALRNFLSLHNPLVATFRRVTETLADGHIVHKYLRGRGYTDQPPPAPIIGVLRFEDATNLSARES